MKKRKLLSSIKHKIVLITSEFFPYKEEGLISGFLE